MSSTKGLTIGKEGGIRAGLVEYVRRMDARGYLHGTLLVARAGQILLAGGYGMANAEHGIPNTPQTKFRVGSITKGFTAAAVLQLQQRGLLSVQDSLGKFLPDFPQGERITLHHLLSHTSGVHNYAGTLDFWHKDMRLFSPRLQDVIGMFKDKPLGFQPGEKFAYSNADYILLTAVMEQVSGLPYPVYLQQHILEPLGMYATGVDDRRTVIAGLASGYSVQKGLIRAEYADMSKAWGAYGMYSTVEDLYRWDRALHTDTLLSEESRKALFTGHYGGFGGYGWFVGREELGGAMRQKAGHMGDTSGYIANLERYQEEEAVVIVLSNLNITPVERISRDLSRILFGEAVEGPEHMRVAELGEEGVRGGARSAGGAETEVRKEGSLSRFTGEYEEGREGGVRIRIGEEDGRLFIEAAKRCGARYVYGLKLLSSDAETAQFFTEFVDEKLRFNLNREGRAESLEYTDCFGDAPIRLRRVVPQS